MKDKRIMVLAGVVAALAVGAGTLVHAGMTVEAEVFIAENFASGSIGSARASADSSQHIGCHIATYPSYQWATCRARNADDVSRQCFTRNALLIKTIAAMPSDAYLAFQWDATTGECTYILTDNTSMVRPRQ